MTQGYTRVTLGLCVVGILIQTTAFVLWTRQPLAVLGCAALALFGFTLGRIHGARPWRELVHKMLLVHADVERIRRWSNGR